MSTGTYEVLAARHRMRRSADFGATVRCGRRVVQPDIVIHARRVDDAAAGPRVGLIIAKSVGTAVQRHRVARRLRHVVRDVLDELSPSDQMVIRALPASRDAGSARLAEQLHAGLQRLREGVHR